MSGLRIEEGKFYRTRDGRKFGPMIRESWEDGEPWTADTAPHYWGSDGKWNTKSTEPTACDLVAEWIVEPIGPVRTVSRKEIVEGTYGRVEVGIVYASGRVDIAIAGQGNRVPFSSADLREAAATFLAVADALDAPTHADVRVE
jgi:hypothetical protein